MSEDGKKARKDKKLKLLISTPKEVIISNISSLVTLADGLGTWSKKFTPRGRNSSLFAAKNSDKKVETLSTILIILSCWQKYSIMHDYRFTGQKIQGCHQNGSFLSLEWLNCTEKKLLLLYHLIPLRKACRHDSCPIELNGKCSLEFHKETTKKGGK